MAGKKGMTGGGRHKVESPRVLMTIRVAQETRTRIQALRRYGFNAGRWMDEQIEKMYNKIYIQEGAILRSEKTYDNDVRYIRKDALLEWLKDMKFMAKSERVGAYQNVIDKLNKM